MICISTFVYHFECTLTFILLVPRQQTLRRKKIRRHLCERGTPRSKLEGQPYLNDKRGSEVLFAHARSFREHGHVYTTCLIFRARQHSLPSKTTPRGVRALWSVNRSIHPFVEPAAQDSMQQNALFVKHLAQAAGLGGAAIA